MKSKSLLLILLGMLIYPLFATGAEWFLKINDKEFSSSEFDSMYDNYLLMSAWQMGVSLEELKTYLNADLEQSAQLKALAEQLSKDKFIEDFEKLVILNMEAEKQNYTKRGDIVQRLKFINHYYIAQSYLMELIDKEKIDISDEEVERRWQVATASNPQLKSMTIEQGLQMVRKQIEGEIKNANQAKLMNKIMSNYKIIRKSEMKKSPEK